MYLTEESLLSLRVRLFDAREPVVCDDILRERYRGIWRKNVKYTRPKKCLERILSHGATRIL